MSRRTVIRLLVAAVVAALLAVAGVDAHRNGPRGIGDTTSATITITEGGGCAFVAPFEAFHTGWYGGPVTDLPVRGPITGRLHRDTEDEATFTADGLRPVTLSRRDPDKIPLYGCATA